jgi:hypothetical protein
VKPLCGIKGALRRHAARAALDPAPGRGTESIREVNFHSKRHRTDEHPLVVRGIGRYGDFPASPRQCEGHFTCPQTGKWSASVPQDHPSSAVFNQWHRQAYVTRGSHFPDPKAQHLAIRSHEVTWHWLGQANEMRGDLEYVSLGGNETAPDQS